MLGIYNQGMEGGNPYQPSELPVEPPGDPATLPRAAYISAALSGTLVFIGATVAIGLGISSFCSPLHLGAMMIMTSAPLLALGLGAISFWETLRLERRKRRQRWEEAHGAPPPSAECEDAPLDERN